MKRKQIGMLIFLAVIVVLLFVTANTPGVVTDPENYQCSVYATVFALLPPVIANGLATVATPELFEFCEAYIQKEQVERIVIGCLYRWRYGQ